MNEIWRDIKNYEGDYQVSNSGNIKSFKKLNNIKILKPGISRGYYFVSLCKNGKVKNFRISRLVAIHFIPNPENKPQINHKNGIKIFNHTENLEWSTNGENQVHAYKIGLKISKKGNQDPQAKLTDEKVKEIRVLKNNGLSINYLSKKFTVSERTIRDVVNNKLWKHVI